MNEVKIPRRRIYSSPAISKLCGDDTPFQKGALEQIFYAITQYTYSIIKIMLYLKKYYRRTII
jgi:hypothetical protein